MHTLSTPSSSHHALILATPSRPSIVPRPPGLASRHVLVLHHTIWGYSLYRAHLGSPTPEHEHHWKPGIFSDLSMALLEQNPPTTPPVLALINVPL